MFELRYYQKDMVDEAIIKLEQYDSLLIQLATGGGKTVVFSSIIKRLIENDKNKIVVVCHRDELIHQTIETLNSFGILCGEVTAKQKKIRNDLRVYVCMVETLYIRLNKNNSFITDCSHLFIDECHIGSFTKIFKQLEGCKRIGFTATPIINKRNTIYKCQYCEKIHDTRIECCYNEKAEKWSVPVTMSQMYDGFIPGIPIKTLIDEGALVGEVIFSYNYYENLEAKENYDFDENEIAEESTKHDLDVLAEYEEKLLGKKTMIFTASTKQNLSLVDVFSEKGYDIKSYDSVNNDTSERSKILEWYRNTQEGILVSTGTFTTGFDDKEVEAIILNRPTKSLSLFHQIVGRGGRVSNKIYKPFFTLIDLGGNIKRFKGYGWSENIDWGNIFYNGLVPAKKKKEILIQCEKCAYNWIGNASDECPDCTYKNQPQQRVVQPKLFEDEPERATTKTTAVSIVPIPNGKKIAEFVKRTTDNKNDYYNILIDRYIDLWKLNRVTSDIYEKRCKTGYLEQRIQEYLEKNYGYVNMLTNGVPRTYHYLHDKIKSKLEACYK